jgi:hypothetical protein
MAATSLWRIKGELGKVVRYAENPDKTENPDYPGSRAAVPEQEQWLNDVISYAVQHRKTGYADERTEVMRRFVTGINCMPETARDEMTATKAQFGKPGGVIAYHGYQSFAPGEATPEMAHEIGVKLARRLWGGRHEVVVATHLDKENHLHSHFVLNTVSFVDGKKFYRSEKDYYDMQKESDALCREYGLSVIEEPKRGKSKQYAEWQAEKSGIPTYRGMVKADFDQALRESMTERQLWDNLYKKGYHIKFGKDITLRPPGKDRGLKLCRNFGEDYSIENIRRQILAQSRPERRVIPPDPPPKKIRFIGTFHNQRRMTGLRALYFYYLYRMGALPKKREPNPKRVYFLFREDIRFIQNISRETRLLVAHGIDTAEQLAAHKDGVNTHIHSLCVQRKALRYKARKITDEGELTLIKDEISALSDKIKELRREVRLCEDIETRSGVMRDKLRRAWEDEKSNVKEVRNDEPFRRRR